MSVKPDGGTLTIELCAVAEVEVEAAYEDEDEDEDVVIVVLDGSLAAYELASRRSGVVKPWAGVRSVRPSTATCERRLGGRTGAT
jgi:hypothetical protein